MDIVSLLVADPQPPIAVQPGERLLYPPAMSPQPLTALDPPPGDPGGDPALPQGLATERVVVALVRVQLLWAAPRPARFPVVHRRDRIHGRLQQLAVVPVGAGEHGRQRRALSVYDEMMFGALLAPIRRVRPHGFPPDRPAPFCAWGGRPPARARLAPDP